MLSAFDYGVQELLELKQLYEKAAGKPYGPPPSPGKGKGKGKGESKGDKAKEKHLDTKKASKEAKRVSIYSVYFQHHYDRCRHRRHIIFAILISAQGESFLLIAHYLIIPKHAPQVELHCYTFTYLSHSFDDSLCHGGGAVCVFRRAPVM